MKHTLSLIWCATRAVSASASSALGAVTVVHLSGLSSLFRRLLPGFKKLITEVSSVIERLNYYQVLKCKVMTGDRTVRLLPGFVL
jgi:hypothetical protein